MLIYKPVTIAQVMETDSFKDATLIAGKNGLNNEVSWIHPLDIWDSAQTWIDGGELIYCCTWIDDPVKTLPLFMELLPMNIAGFCLQLHTPDAKIPEEMITLADKNNCPVIVFHRTVRFLDISKNLLSITIKNVNRDYLTEKKIIENNDWMVGWIKGNLSEGKIAESLNIRRIELRRYRFFVSAVEYEKGNISLQWSEGIYFNISRLLRETFENNQFLFHAFFDNGMLLGIMMDFGNHTTWKERFNTAVTEINKHQQNNGGKPKLIITAGRSSGEVERIPQSYRDAINVMGICQNFHIDRTIYEDLNIYEILSFFIKDDHFTKLRNIINEKISLLIEKNGPNKDRLLNTLKSYYNNNCNKQLTAKELNITRPTLYTRLEQIEDILHCDVDDPEIRITMELAFLFEKVIKK